MYIKEMSHPTSSRLVQSAETPCFIVQTTASGDTTHTLGLQEEAATAEALK